MKALAWTSLALLGALLLQTVLSQVAPDHARSLDPFLLVLVYCGLEGGEVHGMLAGAAAGWIQDVHFGGPVVGLSGFSKVLVGFGVGVAGGRFLLTGPGPRLLVLFTASLADSVIFQQLAAVFDLRLGELSALALVARAATNALLGTALYEVLDQRLRHEPRP